MQGFSSLGSLLIFVPSHLLLPLAALINQRFGVARAWICTTLYMYMQSDIVGGDVTDLARRASRVQGMSKIPAAKPQESLPHDIRSRGSTPTDRPSQQAPTNQAPRRGPHPPPRGTGSGEDERNQSTHTAQRFCGYSTVIRIAMLR